MLEFNTGNSGALILGGRYNASEVDGNKYGNIAREMDDIRMMTASAYGKDSAEYKRVCEVLDNTTPEQFLDKKNECGEKKKAREKAEAKEKALAKYKALNDKLDPEDALAIARMRARDLMRKVV